MALPATQELQAETPTKAPPKAAERLIPGKPAKPPPAGLTHPKAQEVITAGPSSITQGETWPRQAWSGAITLALHQLIENELAGAGGSPATTSASATPKEGAGAKAASSKSPHRTRKESRRASWRG
jgi:hypothetical protein